MQKICFGVIFLYLMSVECLMVAQQPRAGGGVKNLALGQPATQSSIYRGTGFDHGPRFGCDGILECRPQEPQLLVHTMLEDRPWWQVDLGRELPLTGLKLYNRIACCQEKARTVQVLLSSDGSNWRKTYSHDGSTFKVLAVDLAGQKARYVRLQLAERNFLHFQECEVYGYPTVAPPAQAGIGSYAGEYPVTLTFSKATPSGMTSQTCILEVKPNGDLRITNKNGASSFMDDLFGNVDAGGNIKMRPTSGRSFDGRFSGSGSASGNWSYQVGRGGSEALFGTWSTGNTPSTAHAPKPMSTSLRTVQPNISLQTCDPENVTFTVPGGRTATDFSFEGLTAGVTCTTRIHITDRAWGISRGPLKRTGEVFYYNENPAKGTRSEIPVPLKNLTLAPGTYTFHVDGGRGASVIIKFRLI